jgi:P-type Ca2+ transporter type 2C
VAEAVQASLRAGIRLTMITGDYGLTAESLARRIGMLQTAHPLIVTGAELDELDDQGVADLLANGQEIIFARMAPDHKLRLVAAFQSLGEVVAVTGDGVNDAPALRKADVGIVMGQVGTDVAKEAADIIITDDNFLGIVRAIAEGRAIYDNLRKFITYIFASNVPEVLPFILHSLVGLPLVLNFKQILAIDLGTDLLPALALGAELPEPDIMQRPPRGKNQPIVDRSLFLRSFLWLGLIEAGLCYLGFFLVSEFWGKAGVLPAALPGWLEQLFRSNAGSAQVSELAVTVFLSGVVMAQVGNAFACRTERLRGRTLGWLSNPSLLRAVTIEVLLILLMVYYPPLRSFFGHAPIPPAFWIILGAYAPILYLLDWTRKLILRRVS